ncbi:MAG: acyltransferase family protein [Acidimicrobiales bacterium]
MQHHGPEGGQKGGPGGRWRLERRPGLDGLRAVAVAAVVAFHLDRLPGGNLGVDAFFVISGWVITRSLLAATDTDRRTIDLSSFWSARVRRLLPASAVTIVVITVLWTALRIDVAGSLQRDVLFALGWAANWGIISSGGDYWARFGEASPVAHFWSLAVEEQFYLVWPLVLLLVVRLGGRARAIAAVALGLAAASVVTMIVLFDPASLTDTYVHTGARAHSLLFGAAAAVASIAAAERPWIGRVVRLAAAPAAATAAAIVLLSDEGSTWLYWWGFPTFAVAMAVVVMWVAQQPDGGRLAHPALRWVGDRSYGIYLWHWPVILLLAPPRFGLVGPARDALCVLVAVGLAAVSHHWLEQPIRRSPRVTWRWAPAMVVATLLLCALVLTGGHAPTTERVAEASVVTLPPPPTTLNRVVPGDDLDARAARSAGSTAIGGSRRARALARPSTVRAAAGPERVLVLGDSTAVQLADTLIGQAAVRPTELAVASAAFGGCGLSAGSDGRMHESATADGGTAMTDLSGCVAQWQSARERVTAEQIDVVLVSIGAWDGTDIHLPDGHVVSVLDPEGRELIGDAYRAFAADVEDRGARVVWILPADLHLGWGRFPTDLNDPRRWVALRELVRSLGVDHVDLQPWLVGLHLEGADGRPDGVHLAPKVRERFASEVVLPELLGT